MTKTILASICLMSGLAAQAAPCGVAQVMKTIHANRSYRAYEYASDYNGTVQAPTLKQHENSDQYIFWVDINGNTCPAVVTYEPGACINGRGLVKTSSCQ